MEVLTTIISLGLLVGLVISPILILLTLNKQDKYAFFSFLLYGLVATAFLTAVFGWWADTSNQILLSYYGYDFEAIDYKRRFANVASENLERVKNLEISMMGIGWPLKASITYLVYLPYFLIIYLVTYWIRKPKKRT